MLPLRKMNVVAESVGTQETDSGSSLLLVLISTGRSFDELCGKYLSEDDLGSR